MARLGVRGVGLLAGALASLAAPVAQAGSFDTNGDFSFTPDAFRVEGFENFTEVTGLTVIDAKPDATALEGARFVRTEAAGGGGGGATISFSVAAADLVSVRLRMFTRHGSLNTSFRVGYTDVDTNGPGSTVSCFPTGLVTSDGWTECVTAAVRVDGARAPTLTASFQGSNVDIDAIELEITDAVKASVKCAGAFDTVCGAGNFCASGWCRVGAQYVPPLPPVDQRGQLAAFLEGRLRLVFGGHYTRKERLPFALQSVSAMADATDPWTFWNGFATAIHRLQDWHSTISGSPELIGARQAFAVCLVEGDADLSQTQWPSDPVLKDLLVSHTGATGNAGLKAGDRVVAVDGKHPIAWAESLDVIDWGYWHSDDPNGHAEAAERLPGLIQRFAKAITIVRCDAVASTCSAPETIQVADLDPDDASIVYPSCDHRPKYHLATGGPDEATHDVQAPYFGLLADSADGENLYGMIWNDVYLSDPTNNPYAPAMDEFRANASGVILDHRTGNGGVEYAAEYLTQLFRASDAAIAVSAAPTGTQGLFDDPFTVAEGLAIYNSLKSDSVSAYNIGSASARTDLPTALLLARDGSASDWFPLGMKGGEKVRLFGRRTAGAFSTFTQFRFYGMSWQLASGDLVMKDGTPRIGQGVTPDEEIVPLQSDLIVGKDTVYERALSWVRSCNAGACQ